jgi:signal transduction histidine kinase
MSRRRVNPPPPAPLSRTESRSGATPATEIEPRAWILRALTAFLLFSLLALFIVPTLLQRRVSELRRLNTGLLVPAGDVVDDLQIAFIRGSSAFREYAATGDPRFIERYREAWLAEQQALERLRRLAPRIGPEVESLRIELVRRIARAHERQNAVVAGELDRAAYIASIPAQEELYRAVLASIDAIQQAITRVYTGVAQELVTADRLAFYITISLALLTLAAVLAVIWFAARLRSLAIDAERRRRETEEAVRIRDQVLATVSHDLRNPLHTIMLSAGLVLELLPPGDEQEPQRRQLEIIQRAADRANRLIQDLLDVTRLEAGRLSIKPVRQDVAPLLEEVVELHRPQALKKSLSLEAEVRGEVPPVLADHDRVVQVFGNLIGNAIKFTPEGGAIRIAAERAEHDVVFSVSDTGPGIPKEMQQKIFKPFWRPREAEGNGAGLGLAIARGIVEAHRGRIWVESEPGVGSTFFFTLPQATADARAAEDPEGRRAA